MNQYTYYNLWRDALASIYPTAFIIKYDNRVGIIYYAMVDDKLVGSFTCEEPNLTDVLSSTGIGWVA